MPGRALHESGQGMPEEKQSLKQSRAKHKNKAVQSECSEEKIGSRSTHINTQPAKARAKPSQAKPYVEIHENMQWRKQPQRSDPTAKHNYAAIQAEHVNKQNRLRKTDKLIKFNKPGRHVNQRSAR